MVRVLAAIISLLFIQQSFAQQVYFIYLQAENRKPFYARMNSKVYSSNATGYLLLPKLQNGGYRVAVGFPGQNKTEEEFLFTVNNADQGYDLKEGTGGAHFLFNLLNYKMEYPVTGDAVAKKDSGAAGNFGDLLAEAVKDPTVTRIEPAKTVQPEKKDPPKETPVVKKKEELPAPEDTLKQVVEPVQKATAEPMQNNRAPEIQKEEPVPPPVKVNPEKEEAKVTGEVLVVFRKQGKEGAELIYADHTNGQRDTVRIFLPRLSGDTLMAQPPKPIPEPTPEKKPEPVKEIPQPKKDSPFLDIEVKNPNKETPTVLDDKPATEVKQPVADTGTARGKLVMVNTDCKKIAGEDDFVKLRKKMAGETSNDEMVSVAVKTFRTRCFTSEQVKNLSVLLTGDEGKYRFFDAAYPFVYDTDNFRQLEDQLTGEYHKNRFRAMIKR